MIVLFILIIYSCLAGIVEAILYSGKMSKAFKWNEHGLYVTIMILVGVLVLLDEDLSKWDRRVIVACWILSHPLFHDGFYYETRRRIDVPKYRWYSNSTTSEARIEIPNWLRIVLFSISASAFTTYWQFIR